MLPFEEVLVSPVTVPANSTVHIPVTLNQPVTKPADVKIAHSGRTDPMDDQLVLTGKTVFVGGAGSVVLSLTNPTVNDINCSAFRCHVGLDQV